MSVNIGDEKAIITLEVELVSSVKGDPVATEPQEPFFGDIDSDMKQAIAEEVNANIKDSITDAMGDEGVDFEQVQKMQDLIKDIDSKGINNIQNLAKNPESFMENTVMNALARAGPYGALAAAIIATIAGTPALVSAVVQALGVKGAPLNQDFAWTEAEQYNQQFDRVMQFRRLTGDDPVITVTTKGFVVGDPDFVDNSLVDTNIARTARVNLRDSSLQYIHGI